MRGRSLAAAALRESVPLWLAGLVSLLYFRIDTLFVRAMAGRRSSERTARRTSSSRARCWSRPSSWPSPFRGSRAHTATCREQRRLERPRGRCRCSGSAFSRAACAWSAARPSSRLVFGPGLRAGGRLAADSRCWAYRCSSSTYGLTHFLVARDWARATTVAGAHDARAHRRARRRARSRAASAPARRGRPLSPRSRSPRRA